MSSTYRNHSHYSTDTSKDNIVMPFGKWKNHRLKDIPLTYLQWVLYEADPKPWLRDAIRAEMHSRGEGRPHEWQQYRAQTPRNVNPETMLEVVRAGRRFLARTTHPDIGGIGVDMAAVNAAAMH